MTSVGAERYADYLRNRRERFLEEQSAAWAAMEGLLESAGQALSETGREECVEEAGRRAVAATAGELLRIRPIHRSLLAIETYDREALSHADAGPYEEGILKQALRRAPVDSAMQRLMQAEARRLMKMLRDRLRGLAGEAGTAGAAAAWAGKARAKAILARYRRWAGNGAPKAAGGVAPSSRLNFLMSERRRQVDRWRVAQREIAAAVERERALWDTACRMAEASRETAREMEREARELRRAVGELAAYIEQWDGGSFEPPAAEARLDGAGQRYETWRARMRDEVQTVGQSEFEFALEHSARPEVEDRLREASGFDLAMAEEMEQAREVMRYALDAVRHRPNPVIAETRRNVLLRLGECGASERWAHAELEGALAAGAWRAWLTADTMIHAGPAERAILTAKLRGRRLFRSSREAAERWTRSVMSGAADGAAGRYEDFLSGIGWRLPARTLDQAVELRPAVRGILLSGAGEAAAPELYRRLFRLTPVEDPRFLIGREKQMEGFRAARAAWAEGRFAACLVVGVRGSGKTSLLNCAIPVVFSADRVCRLRVEGRIASAAALEAFLRRELALEPRQGLAEAIGAERRVIVFEEVERTFLKTFGGFAGILTLLDLVQQTGTSVLWVLVTNLRCYHLLDRALELNSHFSHRINTMTVRWDELWRVILQRHNLSGLRLSFAEPPERPWWEERWRGRDPQRAFLAALHQQSGGNFRTAFELWQSSVESVENGTIHMRQPLTPDFSPLRKTLAQADHLTLLSVAQHGSLTSAELAAVLSEPEAASRGRLSRLAALEILEHDPEQPGYRIRPEALRLAHDVLQAVNLI